jgi:hypothetical protein
MHSAQENFVVLAHIQSIMLQEERGFAISLKTHDFAIKGINDSLFAANSHFSRIFEERTDVPSN